MYLNDASIDLLCPALLPELRVPRFFPIDYQLQMRNLHDFDGRHPGYRCSDIGGVQWPSLFIGGPSTGSRLHVDSHGTRFWMGVLEGTKTFRLVSPRDTRHLRKSTHCASVEGAAAAL